MTPKNQELLKEFNQRVYGHTDAKKTLLSVINRSKQNYYHIHGLNKPKTIRNSVILLVGKSGTGKTQLVKTLQEINHFPLLMLDATSLEPSGGSKDKLDAKGIERLINFKAEEIIETDKRYFSKQGVIDQMVVFIDEFDKLANPFESSGNWNKQIQYSLLSLIEGNRVYKNLTFILAGAFQELFRKEVKKERIGFYHSKEEDFDQQDDCFEEQAIQFGLVAELVGRITHICQLDTLTIDDYKIILKNKILNIKNTELTNLGLDTIITLTQEEENRIAEKAFNSEMGVRVLQREIDKLALEYELNFKLSY